MDRIKMSRNYILDDLIKKYKEIIIILLDTKKNKSNVISLKDIPTYIQNELKLDLLNAGFEIKEN